MKKCRHLLKALKKGKFGHSLTSISKDMQSHLDDCIACQKLYDDLSKTEQLLHNGSQTSLSRRTKARIRTNIAKAITNKKPFRVPFSIQLWGVAGATAILIFLLMPLINHDDTEPDNYIAQSMNDDVMYDMLDLMDVSLYQYDDSDIENAIVLKSDEMDFTAALDTLFEGTFSYYEEESLSIVSDFDENDWEILRRYLI
jgi:Zn-finger domain-containing protein